MARTRRKTKPKPTPPPEAPTPEPDTAVTVIEEAPPPAPPPPPVDKLKTAVETIFSRHADIGRLVIGPSTALTLEDFVAEVKAEMES